jgi:hypothetical protein
MESGARRRKDGLDESRSGSIIRIVKGDVEV